MTDLLEELRKAFDDFADGFEMERDYWLTRLEAETIIASFLEKKRKELKEVVQVIYHCLDCGKDMDGYTYAEHDSHHTFRKQMYIPIERVDAVFGGERK